MNQEQIFSKISEILTDYLQLSPDEVQPKSHVMNDLGADSLALVEIGFLFSEAFGTPMMTPTDENMIIEKLAAEIEQQMKSQTPAE